MRLSKLARPWAEASLNPLTERLRELRAAGVDVLDVVGANPHEHGLRFPEDALAEAVRQALARVAVYRPDPRGQPDGREAVAGYYQRRGVACGPDHVVLTPGTSLAYLYLFRTLLEPGDEVLVPKPGYPLFADLCALAGVRQRFYHLAPNGRPDFEDLDFQCTPRTRAVVVVSPHNPLGTVFTDEEWRRLAPICERHHLALIHDEVFCEFLTDPTAVLPRPLAEDFEVACTLNGYSKMFALPGHKIGWIKTQSEPLLRALEYVSDTFLPVSELAQAMVAPLMSAGDPAVSRALAEAYRERRAVLAPLRPYPSEGGVYACVPIEGDEDAFCERALEEAHVLVHPGHFYDVPNAIVLTCVAHTDVLHEAVRRLSPLIGGAPLRASKTAL